MGVKTFSGRAWEWLLVLEVLEEGFHVLEDGFVDCTGLEEFLLRTSFLKAKVH